MNTHLWLLQIVLFLAYYSVDAFSTQLSNQDKGEDAFTKLIQAAANILTASDVSENEIEHSYGSASQGQWICSRTARKMQSEVMDGLALKQMAVSSIANEPFGHNQKNLHANGHTKQHGSDSFHFVVKQSLNVLIQSDINKPDGSSSQGRWVDALAGESLEKTLNRLRMGNIRQNRISNATIHTAQQIEDEQCAQWIRWMKNVPSPLFIDLTKHVHELIIDNHNNCDDPWLSTEHLHSVDMSMEQYISRIGCHVILLPSGTETSPLSLLESTGGHIYGKLLYGGVNRFRLLSSGKNVRRVGEKRECAAAGESIHPSWVQLGGLERRYESLDIGPAAVLELTLLPRLWQDLPTVFDKSAIRGEARTDMVLHGACFGWNPSTMLGLLTEDQVAKSNTTQSTRTPRDLSVASQSTNAISYQFQSKIGGLQPQIDAIVRRVLDGRSIYSHDSTNNCQQMLEAEELAALGLQPVRGLLLYGPPGTGKTLLAREIAKTLGARPPKIVAAPELLDRWVGGSERCVRELFREAEEELALCKAAAGSDDSKAFLRSALHVIIIDEIDAVFRKRTDSEDSGSITRNSVVNQILSKIDGVKALPNVLTIAMTNRRELIDEALLRPGRLEVQVEVPLPDMAGRREILQIHFGGLRRKGRLSFPLRCAIDGVLNSDGLSSEDTISSKRQQLRELILRPLSAINNINFVDLASEAYTGEFSGADIAGLVRNAGSIALARARADGSGVNGLLITLDDVLQALDEVKA